MTDVQSTRGVHIAIRDYLTLTSVTKAAFCLTLVVILFVNVINIGNPILERHSWRQTQTALTAYYFVKDGFRLDYITPVIGEAWSIPFEFPLFQELVAVVTSLTRISLTEAGRLLNLLFTLLACIPVFFSLKKLSITDAGVYLSLAMMLSSPIYLFWSGTFLIEGAALFFLCSFIYYAIKLYKHEWEVKNFALMALFLTLGLLQKVTTILPALGVITVALGTVHLRMSKLKENAWFGLKLLISVVVPVAIAYAWVKYSDIVKMHNPIGQQLTSSALQAMNYGDIQQRFSADLWIKTILKRNLLKSSFIVFGLGAICATLLRAKDAKMRTVVALSFLLFLLPFLVFTNLHIVHDYYQMANSLFLSIATGISVAWVCGQYLPNRPFVHAAIVLAFVASSYFFFGREYYHLKMDRISGTHRTIALSDFIKSNTPSERPVIWYGFSWSGECAFYSERKALTVPSKGNFDIDVIENTPKFLNTAPSAIVQCPIPIARAVTMAIEKKYGAIRPVKVAGCDVYLLAATAE